jgi:hypothetical protein
MGMSVSGVDMSGYVCVYRTRDLVVYALGGVDWHDVKRPHRWHKCWAQTRGFTGAALVERCACGAVRYDGHGAWVDRNSRHGDK